MMRNRWSIIELHPCEIPDDPDQREIWRLRNMSPGTFLRLRIEWATLQGSNPINPGDFWNELRSLCRTPMMLRGRTYLDPGYIYAPYTPNL